MADPSGKRTEAKGERKMSVMQRLFAISRGRTASTGRGEKHFDWIEPEAEDAVSPDLDELRAPKAAKVVDEPVAREVQAEAVRPSVSEEPDNYDESAASIAAAVFAELSPSEEARAGVERAEPTETAPPSAPAEGPKSIFAFEIADEAEAQEPEPEALGVPEEAPSMWSLVTEEAEAVAPQPEPEAPAEDAVRPASARRRSLRVKTRLLGFDHSNGESDDIHLSGTPNGPEAVDQLFPVGWIVVVRGPGKGKSFALQPGVSQIGRDEEQAIQLDFGDLSISRTNHAAIAFDEEERKFYIGHGGKSNLVRLNGRPLLSTEPAKNGDMIRIGETTLRLVTLCGEGFTWADEEKDSEPAKG